MSLSQCFLFLSDKEFSLNPHLFVDVPVVDLVVGVLVALHEVVVDLLDGVLAGVTGSLGSQSVVERKNSRKTIAGR